MTLTERVIARASGRRTVEPGDEVWARVDLVVMHDSSGPRRMASVLEELGGRVWDPERVVLAVDHFTPPGTPRQAEILHLTRAWARKYGIRHFFDSRGILHNLLLEEALVGPGMLVAGGDAQTPMAGAFGAVGIGVGSTELATILATGEMWLTVPRGILIRLEGRWPSGITPRDATMEILRQLKADFAVDATVEFAGQALLELSPEDRSVFSNQSVEMGAQCAMVVPDGKLREWLRQAGRLEWDDDLAQAPVDERRYQQVYTFDVSSLSPRVACPPNVDQVRPVEELVGLPLDRAYLGSCAGAKYSDLVRAARVLRGRRVRIPLSVVPATMRAYRRALEDGTLGVLLEAGAIVQAPGCSACGGFHSGVLGPGERCIATTTRNFPGRMGHPSSQVYLASAYTVAASAVEGAIADPRRFLGEER